MKFNHLNLPETWQAYFSKYPNGLSLLEALIQWASQVNDMTDNLNTTNAYIDAFKLSFDDQLVETVDVVLHQWDDDGILQPILDLIIGTRFTDLNEDLEQISINVKNYGALGDGVTNDSVAFQNANDYLVSQGGGTLYVPSGIYLVNFVIDSNINLVGNGVDLTILKSVPGSNQDVIIGRNFASYTGTTEDVLDAGVRFTRIERLTVDGNKGTQTSGRGIALWGCYLCINDVIVQNCKDEGIWTEFTSILPPTPTTFRNSVLESVFRNIKILYCDGDAWYFAGPHDSIIDNYVAVGNAGWAFNQRDFDSFVTIENANVWKNGNGFYIGTGIAGHDIVADNDGAGLGFSFNSNSGNSRIVNLRAYGWAVALDVKGQANQISGVISNSDIGLRVTGLSLSSLDLVFYQCPTTIDLVSEISRNYYKIISSIPAGGVLKTGASFVSSSHVNIQSTSDGIVQFAENSLKVKGWTFDFPLNNGTILTTASSPTTVLKGPVLKQTAIANLSVAPTAADFNNLLAKLRSAGILEV